MCIDYMNLNKVCPKDTYHLPSIDQLVDNTSGYEMLSFLDVIQGTTRSDVPPNEDKTMFMTERSNYYYQVISFSLKNVGATYQCLMDKIFHDLLGKTMEVYVDSDLKLPTTKPNMRL